MRKNELFITACGAISRYQRFLSLLRYGQFGSGPGGDRDHYGFIPNGPESVILSLTKAMDLLKKHNPLPPDALNRAIRYKFLDAGCGAGNIMLLAECLGFDAWGIERDPATIRLARKLFSYASKRGRGITKADLVGYKKYGEYDVIYYYQPMCSNKMEIFVNALCEQMKVGAIVIPFGSWRQFRKDKRFRSYKIRYLPCMYRKTKA